MEVIMVGAEGVVQFVEYLPSIYEALTLIPSTG